MADDRYRYPCAGSDHPFLPSTVDHVFWSDDGKGFWDESASLSLLIDVLVNFGFSDSDAKRRNDLDRGFISHSSSNGLFIYKTIEAYDGHRRDFRWVRLIYRLVYRVQL